MSGIVTSLTELSSGRLTSGQPYTHLWLNCRITPSMSFGRSITADLRVSFAETDASRWLAAALLTAVLELQDHTQYVVRQIDHAVRSLRAIPGVWPGPRPAIELRVIAQRAGRVMLDHA